MTKENSLADFTLSKSASKERTYGMLLSLIIIALTQSVSDRVRLSYFLKQALAKLNGLGFVAVEQN